MIKTKNCSSKKATAQGHQHTSRRSTSEVSSSGQRHLRSNSASACTQISAWPWATDASSQLVSRAVTSLIIPCTRMWSVLHIHTCKKACLKDLKNQHCKKRQQRCDQTSDSTSSLVHIPLFCVYSDFFPPLLIYWFAAGGEYWGL